MNCPVCHAELSMDLVDGAMLVCVICGALQPDAVRPKLASQSPIKNTPEPGSAAWWLRQMDRPKTTRGDVPRGKGNE